MSQGRAPCVFFQNLIIFLGNYDENGYTNNDNTVPYKTTLNRFCKLTDIFFEMRIHMKMIQTKSLLHWSQIYRLYCTAFPSYERKPFSVIRSMQKKGKSDVWYFEQNKKFAGLVTTINSDDVILIDYFAVSPESRGRGIGSEIIVQLKDYYSGKGIFVEIESVFEECENPKERLRRKQFYINNGLLPMKVMVILFGVKMELMGINCTMTYDEYYAFYRDNYGEFAANNIRESSYPQGE